MSSTDASPRLGGHAPSAAAGIPPAFVVIIAGMVAALHIGKIPPAIPVLRDALGLSLVEAGFLLSMVQMAGMLGGVFIGLAADGFGLRRSVLLGQAVLVAASLAGAWATQPGELLALRAIEGFGFLLCVLPVPSLIRQLVPPSRLALHLGLWGTYMATGTSLVLAAGPLLMGAIGWQGLWVALAMASAAVAGWLFLRVPSDRVRRAMAAMPAGAAVPARAQWRARLRATLGSVGPWRVAITFSVYSSQWLAVIGFLPAIYAQAGLSGQLAGLLTALACLSNVTGNVAAGRLLHRGVCARHLLYAGFLAMAATAFVAFSPLTAEAPVARYLAVVLFSAIGGLIPATLFALAVHVAPDEHTVSTTVGWMQQCSSAGQFLGPPLVAWVAGMVGGWQWTWVITGLASLVGLVLSSRMRYQRA
ncbi:MAG TPA: MFS transporter [Thauera sp.]|uniref:MFS transporter n=1 Tax=Thauera sp. TaxID=1905334 RepID=UPI000FACCB0C|nr:MFS transporter [Thauera sp.]MCB1946381.1 MFS transporter [Thauera sp.]MCP5225375.1 MFS transporter [Thauera sp.]RTL26486.1 MAG: MFS transporter [Rhodocyclaceae bacterium]HRV77211.1 MFS transporter [Thauera sp.]